MGKRRASTALTRLAPAVAGASFVLAGSGEARAGVPIALTTETVATGLESPTFLTVAPGDGDRYFIVERPGRIRVVLDGELLAEPFLDIEAIVNSDPPERAMAGLAFHPDYATNGQLFVSYTDLAGDGVVARYEVTADPDVADPGSAEVVLTVSQPGPTHNLGWVGFGPDGFLYIGTGDGGNSTGGEFAQEIDSLLGKVLRIDPDSGAPYGIPPDNPFAGEAGLDEIWALGLRNPWRCSFDRATGDFWIGDVGQSSWEEINSLAAGAPGGANFGWHCMEGCHCHAGGDCTCDDEALSDPVHEYSHDNGCAVIGGYVYRGSLHPQLTGRYVFGDVCAGKLWAFDPVEQTTEPLLAQLPGVYSLGEDHDGELYVVTSRDVRRIVFSDCNDNGVPDELDLDGGGSADCNGNAIPDECEADCNGNGVQDDCDITGGASDDVNGNGVPDECESIADIDGDGVVGILDLLILLGQWGPCGGGGIAACPGDIDNDGVVGILDLLLLFANWGK